MLWRKKGKATPDQEDPSWLILWPISFSAPEGAKRITFDVTDEDWYPLMSRLHEAYGKWHPPLLRRGGFESTDEYLERYLEHTRAVERSHAFRVYNLTRLIRRYADRGCGPETCPRMVAIVEFVIGWYEDA